MQTLHCDTWLFEKLISLFDILVIRLSFFSSIFKPNFFFHGILIFSI